MKKLFKVMGVVAVCAAFAVVVYNQVNAKPENTILAKNIEALSQSEGGGSAPIYFFRVDEDCEYLFTGKKGSTISFSIGGKSVSITLDENGEYTYVYKYGRTRCTIGGYELCEARYCPQLVYN